MLDAKGRQTNFQYNIDNTLNNVSYTTAAGSPLSRPKKGEGSRLNMLHCPNIRRGFEDPADEELVRRRLKLLRGYTWSSYRAYAGYIKGPAPIAKGRRARLFRGTNAAATKEVLP